jgi:hypothetical protein
VGFAAPVGAGEVVEVAGVKVRPKEEDTGIVMCLEGRNTLYW